MKTFHYLVLSILFLSSCDKFEWYNPYDPECPKELFTPSSPGAAMEGNSVKLTWSQQNDDISGFALYRSAEGESITNLTQTQKTTTQYIDASITPGKKYTYYVVAVAGTNKSDTVKAEIIPVIPVTISTGSVTELAATSAKVSGNITNAGGGTVTSRGICWSTTPNPTVNSSKTTEGTGAGEFISTLSNLLAGTTYYARAYGENSRGISYGLEVTFTTLGPPKLTTTAVSNITATSATSGGTIISDGGSPITETGVCWSTSVTPTITDSKTSEGATKTSFTSQITGLKPSTTYFIRSYATNKTGTSYGEQFSFTTNSTMSSIEGQGVTDIDGNSYKTVIIDGKEWMAENLKVTRFNDGSLIVNGNSLDNIQWSDLGSSALTDYNKIPNNSIQFGKLYNWFAVNDAKKICPNGWHVSTDQEWQNLIDLAEGISVAGGKLKQAGTGLWQTPNTGATNIFQLNILPAGWRERSGYFGLGNVTMFWTGPSVTGVSYFRIELESITPTIKRVATLPETGLSVRCVKD